MNFLQVSGISKQADKGFTLNDISFRQQKLQKTAIAGETGSGKSTLLKVIAGLAQADSGSVLFEGKRVKGPEEKLVAGHPGIAYLTQHYELAGFLRVEQVLKYANKLSEKEAESMYEVCRISHLLKRKTDQLSGGEKQRIAIARLLLSSPKLLLLDEPFSSLDMVHKSILKSVIHDIGEKLKITCMLISHDPLDTLSWADEILVMKDGQLLQHGTPEQIYRQPVNRYVAGLFGKYNLLKPAQNQALSSLAGPVVKSKNMLIRPENFRIVPKEQAGLEGKVHKTTFFGSYTEVEVLLQKTYITIKTVENDIAVGSSIYLSLAPDGIWYV